MTCAETEILLHALLDGELDAGHARDVEGHLADCPRCAAHLDAYRALHQAMSAPQLRYAAPVSLRRSIEAMLPPVPAAPRRANNPTFWANRRSVLKGFVMGTALSTAIAASLVLTVIGTDQDQRVLGDVVSAHVRSLQGEHLTDVQTSDQHTVKPWFNGKLDISPPVVDLTAQGFTLIGGRLDYLDGKTVASIVYRRRKHVINLFVADGAASENQKVKRETMQGFNILRWTTGGFEFFAVSDINAEELQEFVDKFEAASHPVNRS
jgi:anti-sigma factor RsiW